MKKPNILFIQADQMAAALLPIYGHPLVKAPHLQALARDGVVFDNAYCNNPICASSRFSMMSGQLSSRIGAYDNAAEFPASIPTFAHYLRALDYRTCLSGKMHFVGPDQLHGFEERLTTDIYPSDFGWTPDWLEGEIQEPPSGMSMRSVVEAGICERSLQLDYDEEVAYHAEQKLYDYARQKGERPFFLAASFTHPHNPFTITPEYWNLYRHEDIDMPVDPGLPLAERDAFSRRYAHLIRMDEHVVTEAHVRNARHAYYGMISYIDDKVGRLLRVLERTGLREDTIVVFTADHGEMMGERGLWYKFNPFERSIRVPLLIAAPGGLKGARQARPVSLVDLLPTFLDFASDGTPPKLIDPVDGHSLAPLLRGEDAAWNHDVLVEFTAEGTIAPCLVLRRGSYKYIYCEPDPGLLYDLAADPHELHNLCGKPAHAKLEKEMLAEILRRWNPPELKRLIIESQQRRRFLQGVLLAGEATPWDWQPKPDAHKRYLRSGGSPTQVKGLARFPFVPPVPPDNPRRKAGPAKRPPQR